MTNGEKIRIARKSADYTVTAAAKRLGISVKRLQHYEHDELEPSPELILRMAETFGVKTRALCSDDGAILHVPVHLAKGAIPPVRKFRGAGFDLLSPKAVYLSAGERTNINLGIKLAMPDGYYAALISSPSLFERYGVMADGFAESKKPISLTLSNQSTSGIFINIGDKIAEMYILPCELVDLGNV